MTEPTPPPPEEQQQQVTVAPWGWQFNLIGDTPAGKMMMIRVIRPPLGEVLILPAVVSDMRKFHDQLGAAIRQAESGIVPASPADIANLMRPPNGGRTG